jgi:hypothetical protein
MPVSLTDIDKIKQHVYPLFNAGDEVLILPTPNSDLAGDFYHVIGGGRHGLTHSVNKAAVERYGCKTCMVRWDMPPTLNRVGTEEFIACTD